MALRISCPFAILKGVEWILIANVLIAKKKFSRGAPWGFGS